MQQERTTISLTKKCVKKFDSFAWYAGKVLDKSVRSISATELLETIMSLADVELARINKQTNETRKNNKE